MKTVLLQLERLRRHYEIAVRTYDHVSLLDLSHSLRLWTELKHPLATIAPEFSAAICFKTGFPARKVLKASRGFRYVFSYMPGGVRTYASKGLLASSPDMGRQDGQLTVAIAVRNSPPLLELGNFCVVAKAFDQPLVRALGAEVVSRCTFVQWLGSEAVRLAYVNEAGDLVALSISREMVVRRVANTLDGSHPSAGGHEDIANEFDAPVHHLLQYRVGGLPLPYFIVLKIAQDLLDFAPNLLSLPEGEKAT